VRLALAVLVAFCSAMAFLAVQQEAQRHAAAPSALGYLLGAAQDKGADGKGHADGEGSSSDDPLNIASERLELIGVAQQGAVVGYATNVDVTQTMLEIDRAMTAQGWAVFEMSSQGISSYVRQDEASGSPWAYVLFICSERGSGSSVVAELF
jgi:hypothetical protein